MNGRGANRRAFEASRGARFTENQRRVEEQKEAERRAGTRRTMMLVDADEVRDDDMVAVKTGGFEEASTVTRDQFEVDGKAFVQRFVTTQES